MDDAVVLGSDLWLTALMDGKWDAAAKKRFDAEADPFEKQDTQMDYVLTLILLAKVIDADFQQNAARIGKATGGSVRASSLCGRSPTHTRSLTHSLTH